MRNFIILLISVYFVSSNCLFSKECDLKCKIVYRKYNTSLISGTVIKNTCRCIKFLGTHQTKSRGVISCDNFCLEYYNKPCYYISDFYPFTCSCYDFLKCTKLLCKEFCSYVFSEKQITSHLCESQYECKCKIEK